MENTFNIWFLEKGVWLILVGVAGIVGVWAISLLIFKGLKLVGIDSEKISDPSSKKIIDNVKNISVIIIALVVVGIPSFFGILSILNIGESEEGFNWALGASYKLIISNGVPILIVLILAYISLRIAGTIMPNLIKLYLNSSKRSDDVAKENEKRVETFAIVIRSVLRIFVVLIALLTILSILGVPVTSLVAGISILGIALGLGSQSLVKDVIQGMLIIAENQLRKGDIVKFNGRAGLVEDLNLRRILVRDLDGALHIIPNGSTDIITNLTSQWSRVNIEIYVSYEEDLENTIKILNEIGSKISNNQDVGKFIKEAPKVFTITSFTDSGVKLKFVGVTLPGKQWDVRTKLIREIKQAFDKAEIKIPYNQIRVVN